MMPLITRRSSTRGTPRGLFGSNGANRAYCVSLNQNPCAITLSVQQDKVNHVASRRSKRFMGPEPRLIDL